MTAPIPLLDLRREYAQIADEIQAGWAAALQEMRLLGGREVATFEREIAAFVGVPAAVAVASGSDALLLAMVALEIGPGDRIVMPANAFVAAVEAVYRVGAIPVLVDVQPDGFAPDVDAVVAALPAAAVLVVQLYGHAFDLAPIRAACTRHGARLIEDASHAHGARRAARRVGSLGDVGCFSAGVVKNLGAYGDAGFVTTTEYDLAKRITVLRNHGQERKNHHAQYAFNSRLDELQAVVLRVKLRHLDVRNRRRRAIAGFYHECFRPLGIELPEPAPDEEPVYHQYVIRTEARDALQAHLRQRGIETGIHYPVPLHRQPAWTKAYETALSFPNAERLSRRILSLPVFPDLTDGEVEHIASSVAAFFADARPSLVPSL